MRNRVDSKERVLRTLEHQEADRVPLDLMVLQEPKDKLLAHYKVHDWDHVLEELCVDVRWVNEWEDTNPVEWGRNSEIYFDNWGIMFPARESFRELKNLPIMDFVG